MLSAAMLAAGIVVTGSCTLRPMAGDLGEGGVSQQTLAFWYSHVTFRTTEH